MGTHLTMKVPTGQADAELQDVFGKVFFVDTVNGSNNNSGRTADKAFATMAKAFANVTDDSVIYVRGDVREQIIAPLGIQGCKIIGLSGGNTRHDDGVRWREPASATADTPLLRLREQGWEVENILFVPGAGIAGVEIRRAEDATNPDGGHCIFRNCKFIGANVTTTVGIEDIGGSHHVRVEHCEFFTLASAIVNTSTSIANPLRWVIEDSIFIDNTEHIDAPFTESVIQRNRFDHATTNIDCGDGAGGNFWLDNQFSEAIASITTGNAYTVHATLDTWRNWGTDNVDYGIPS